MTRILFVCHANVCRSPMALAVAHKMMPGSEAKRSIWRRREPRLDAAGVSPGARGEPVDARAVAALQLRGYSAVARRSRRVSPRDFERFDLVLAMDRATLEQLRERCPPAHLSKLALFLDHVPGLEGQDVPDPYYGDAQGFEAVLDLCERGVRGLLHKLA